MVRVLTCLAVAACSPLMLHAQAPTRAPVRAEALPAARQTWTPIARTVAITASLDTTRIERAAGGASRLWYRFAYATPLVLGDDAASRFAATEMRMEVDCRGQRARTLTLRMETTEGVQADVPASDSAWKRFSVHPMGAAIFAPACTALGLPSAAPKP